MRCCRGLTPNERTVRGRGGSASRIEFAPRRPAGGQLTRCRSVVGGGGAWASVERPVNGTGSWREFPSVVGAEGQSPADFPSPPKIGAAAIAASADQIFSRRENRADGAEFASGESVLSESASQRSVPSRLEAVRRTVRDDSAAGPAAPRGGGRRRRGDSARLRCRSRASTPLSRPRTGIRPGPSGP